MYGQLQEQYWNHQLTVHDSDIIALIQQQHQYQHQQLQHNTRSQIDVKPIVSGHSVATDFKKRHDISYRRAHKRASPLSDETKDSNLSCVLEYYDQLLTAVETLPRHLIINVDETRLPNTFADDYTNAPKSQQATVNTRVTEKGHHSTSAVWYYCGWRQVSFNDIEERTVNENIRSVY